MSHLDKLLDIIKPSHPVIVKWWGIIISPPAVLPLTAKEKWKTSNHERRWSLRYDKPYPTLKTYLEYFKGFETIDLIDLLPPEASIK